MTRQLFTDRRSMLSCTSGIAGLFGTILRFSFLPCQQSGFVLSYGRDSHETAAELVIKVGNNAVGTVCWSYRLLWQMEIHFSGSDMTRTVKTSTFFLLLEVS